MCSLDSRSVSALEVLRNRTLQIDIYLLTYLLTDDDNDVQVVKLRMAGKL